jgi:hypothetical protein
VRVGGEDLPACGALLEALGEAGETGETLIAFVLARCILASPATQEAP